MGNLSIEQNTKACETGSKLDLITIVLLVGLHGWCMTEKRLHPDHDIKKVYVSSEPHHESVECLGLLHVLERMSIEEVKEELEQIRRRLFGE